MCVVLAIASLALTVRADEPLSLPTGARVERDLVGGGSDLYRVALDAGQSIRVSIEQRGVDVELYVESAAGETIVGVDDVPALTGVEAVVFVAPAAASYGVRVSGAEGAPAGRYALESSAPRPATDDDRAAAEISKLVYDAQGAAIGGDGAAALPMAERAVALAERRFGPNSAETGRALFVLGAATEVAGDTAKAETVHRRAVETTERARGADAPEITRPLSSLSVLAYTRSDLPGAAAIAERTLSVVERSYGPSHVSVADALTNLAAIYLAAADFDRAEARQARAIEIYERALGPDAPELANAINTLASLYGNRERYDEALPLYERALAIRQRALGPESAEVATSFFSIAQVAKARGEYARARELHLRSLAIREKAFGPDSPEVAPSLDALATLARISADYAEAERRYGRALSIFERAFGPEHPRAGLVHASLATLYAERGDYDAADREYRRSLAILEKAIGPDHPNVGVLLMNYSATLRRAGREAEAVRRLERATAILEAKLGPESLSYAQALDELGSAIMRAEPARAATLFERALRVREKATGPESHAVAGSLASIGALERSRRDFAGARSAYERMLAIVETLFGDGHPDVSRAYGQLAELAWASGDTARAVELRARAGAARERDFARNLASGSERQKLLYLDASARDLGETVSLHLSGAPRDQTAARMALETILRRKGRALDAMSRTIEALRRRGTDDDRALLDRLAEVRARLSAATLAGPGAKDTAAYRRELDELDRLADELEARAGARFAELRAVSAEVTLDAVRAEIPEGAALVEIASYFPYDPKAQAFGARRYAVYVTGRTGDVRAADLGEAAGIDALVGRLVSTIRARRDDRALARRLDERVMRPARRLAGATTRLLVSPDGELNLAPFAALVDERGRRLVEGYEITYLASGRDLLRLSARAEAGEPPLVVAAPDFGRAPEAGASRAVRLRPGSATEAGDDALTLFFPALPATAAEARSVAGALPGARVLTGAAATKEALLAAHGPRVLHVATHGFFLSDASEVASDTRRVRLLNSSTAGALPDARAAFSALDPLVRSGLALAGANERPDAGGVLTALEATSLDLWGTRLVVLSACDTGVGEARSGDGVYGLRRALVLAGSESQIMSLWPVSDAGTRELMTDYYRALGAGRGRGDALRDVQLRMLRDPKRRAPYYWASFIQSGDWRPLAER